MDLSSRPGWEEGGEEVGQCGWSAGAPAAVCPACFVDACPVLDVRGLHTPGRRTCDALPSLPGWSSQHVAPRRGGTRGRYVRGGRPPETAHHRQHLRHPARRGSRPGRTVSCRPSRRTGRPPAGPALAVVLAAAFPDLRLPCAPLASVRLHALPRVHQMAAPAEPRFRREWRHLGQLTVFGRGPPWSTLRGRGGVVRVEGGRRRGQSGLGRPLDGTRRLTRRRDWPERRCCMLGLLYWMPQWQEDVRLDGVPNSRGCWSQLGRTSRARHGSTTSCPPRTSADGHRRACCG